MREQCWHDLVNSTRFRLDLLTVSSCGLANLPGICSIEFAIVECSPERSIVTSLRASWIAPALMTNYVFDLGNARVICDSFSKLHTLL